MATSTSLLSQRRPSFRRKGITLTINATSIRATNACTESSPTWRASLSDIYDVHEAIGQGSTAVVYRAVRLSDGEQVALKVVRTVDEEMMAGAEAEFRLLQKLSHPGVVRAIDLHSSHNSIVMALSLCAGRPLDEAGLKLPEAQAHRLFVQLLEVLNYLHQQRVVHRDVKPQNVMVSTDLNTLQLLDFNIARYLPDGGALSPNCTPAYAPPEVVMGGSVSEASDIWGAGLCLHMMLCGVCPSVSMKEGNIKLKASDLAQNTQACKDVAKQCLEIDHSMRPAAMTLLQTAWVRQGITMGSGMLRNSNRSSRCSPIPSAPSSPVSRPSSCEPELPSPSWTRATTANSTMAMGARRSCSPLSPCSLGSTMFVRPRNAPTSCSPDIIMPKPWNRDVAKGTFCTEYVASGPSSPANSPCKSMKGVIKEDIQVSAIRITPNLCDREGRKPDNSQASVEAYMNEVFPCSSGHMMPKPHGMEEAESNNSCKSLKAFIKEIFPAYPCSVTPQSCDMEKAKVPLKEDSFPKKSLPLTVVTSQPSRAMMPTVGGIGGMIALQHAGKMWVLTICDGH